MALQDIRGLGHGGAGLNDKLPAALKELQGLQMTAVSGAAASTSIAVAGIGVNDTIISIMNVTDGANCAAPTVQAAGQVRTTTDTTAKKLIVAWFKK